jgi:hypothetical protein
MPSRLMWSGHSCQLPLTLVLVLFLLLQSSEKS